MITLLSEHDKRGFIVNSAYKIYKMVPLLYRDENKTNIHEFNVFDDSRRALMLTYTNKLALKAILKAIGFDRHCLARY